MTAAEKHQINGYIQAVESELNMFDYPKTADGARARRKIEEAGKTIQALRHKVDNLPITE